MKVIKACLVFSILFLLFTVKASAAGLDEIHYIGNQLHLTSTKVDESSVGNQVPRAPMAPLTISIDGNSFICMNSLQKCRLNFLMKAVLSLLTILPEVHTIQAFLQTLKALMSF